MKKIGRYIKRNAGALVVGIIAAAAPEWWVSAAVVVAGSAGYARGVLESF